MVDKSLVRQIEQSDGEPRFLMLETIREYGLEKMAACGEAPLTRRAHAAYCLVLAEEGAAEDISASHTQWLDRFELEHNNFRSALDWLTETGNAEWGLRLGAALFRFWEMREHLSEGRERLGKLLKLPGAAASTIASAPRSFRRRRSRRRAGRLHRRRFPDLQKVSPSPANWAISEASPSR